MLALILKRLFWLAALLLALSYVCFAMIHLSKGSVVYAKSPQAVSAELKAQIESNLNLDKPLNEQYLSWLKGAMSGDFGLRSSRSFVLPCRGSWQAFSAWICRRR